MSEKPFSYNRTLTLSETRPQEQILSKSEALQFVKESLNLITGGCASCANFEDKFCLKHQKRVLDTDPRCEYFARRTSKTPEENSKAFYRNTVYEMLGVRGETLDRLSGT